MLTSLNRVFPESGRLPSSVSVPGATIATFMLTDVKSFTTCVASCHVTADVLHKARISANRGIFRRRNFGCLSFEKRKADPNAGFEFESNRVIRSGVDSPNPEQLIHEPSPFGSLPTVARVKSDAECSV